MSKTVCARLCPKAEHILKKSGMTKTQFINQCILTSESANTISVRESVMNMINIVDDLSYITKKEDAAKIKTLREELISLCSI